MPLMALMPSTVSKYISLSLGSTETNLPCGLTERDFKMPTERDAHVVGWFVLSSNPQF